jgi:hypothetical protein
MKREFSEQQLSEVFERQIGKRLWTTKRPRIGMVLREMQAHQGQPDFVISIKGRTIPRGLIERIVDGVSRPSAARVLSLLGVSAARSEEYLLKASGLSGKVLVETLRNLEERRLIDQPRRGRFVLRHEIAMTNLEFWAFEVKVDDWQRALYQGLQYRTFAHRVSIVLGEKWVHRVEPHRKLFGTFGIGVIAVDPQRSSLRAVIEAKRRAPTSRFQYWCALARFLGQRTGPTRANPRVQAILAR